MAIDLKTKKNVAAAANKTAAAPKGKGRQTKKQLKKGRVDTILSVRGGKKTGGGSDLAGRVFVHLGWHDKAELMTAEQAMKLCRKVSEKEAVKIAQKYIAGLPSTKDPSKHGGKGKPSPANKVKLDTFTSFVANDGFKKVADALEGLLAGRAKGDDTISQAVTINGVTIKTPMSVDQLANRVFGLNLTDSRMRKHGEVLA